MAILRLFSNNPEGLCVYVTLMDPLSDSSYTDWHNRFSALGLKVVILTGETGTDLKVLARCVSVPCATKSMQVCRGVCTS